MDFRDVDKLTTAGSAAIKVVSFELPYSALSALRQLDRAFDVETTAETERAGYEFEAWRKLKVNRMELRFQFYTSGDWNLVSVYGLQAKTVPLVTSFKSDRAEECYYTHFLSRLSLCVKDQFVAVAMGQNARLGGASLLHTLPEGLLRLLMQPVYAALEPWDEDQEVEFQTAIAMRELEETKALIRQLVASDEESGEDVIVFKGEFQNLKYHMAGLCAKLDKRFGVFTDEVYCPITFLAKRTLTGKTRTLHFQFKYFAFNQAQSFIRVTGLGRAEHALTIDAYTYLVGLLSTEGVLTVTH